MQTSFGSQVAYSFNQSGHGFSAPSFPPYRPPFSQQSAMQYSQQASSRSFGGNSTSSYNQSYFSQQMSRGPNGFNQSMASSNYSTFNQQRSFPGMGNRYDNRSMSNRFETSSYAFCQQRPFPNMGNCFDNRSTSNRWQSGYQACDNRFGQPTQWTATDVKNGKSTINLGSYSLSLDKSNSSVMLTNSQTGNQTKIWGDPHIDLNSGTSGQTSGMFNGPLTFNLPDHTKVAIGTQQASGNPGVSYADSVTITHGNRAYVVHGLSEKDQAPLTVERSNNGFSLSRQSPQGSMSLYSSNNGTGWFNPLTHSAVKASDFHV